MAGDLWPRFRRIHYGFRRIDYGKALTITAMIVFPWVIIAAGIYFVMHSQGEYRAAAVDPKPAKPEPNRGEDKTLPRPCGQFWMIRRSTSAQLFPQTRVRRPRTLWVQRFSARPWAVAMTRAGANLPGLPFLVIELVSRDALQRAASHWRRLRAANGPSVAERGRETGRRLDCSHLGQLGSRLSAVEQLMPVGVDERYRLGTRLADARGALSQPRQFALVSALRVEC